MFTKFQVKTLDGKTTPFRLATPKEIQTEREADEIFHVYYGCTKCGLSHWSSKNIALSKAGEYIGPERIFFRREYDQSECTCGRSALKMIVPNRSR